MDLITLPASEREKHYASIFCNKFEPLHLLELPTALSAAYPAIADEIHAAYFRHTTFTVEVWLNYDTAAQRFYNDARAGDCGRLRLPPKLIERRDLAKFEYGKVRFEVCTPFKRLARVLVSVAPSVLGEEEGKVHLKPLRKALCEPYPDDDLLSRGVKFVLEGITSAFTAQGRSGLNFADLVTLAGFFRIEPREEDHTPAGWLRDTDAWMNLRRPVEWNEGYVKEV